MWLQQHSAIDLDLHVFHSEMSTYEHAWAVSVLNYVCTVLVSDINKCLLTPEITQALEQHTRVVSFGSKSRYQEPLDYFCSIQEKI